VPCSYDSDVCLSRDRSLWFGRCKLPCLTNTTGMAQSMRLVLAW
jgi:hypothetical protein